MCGQQVVIKSAYPKLMRDEEVIRRMVTKNNKALMRFETNVVALACQSCFEIVMLWFWMNISAPL